MKLRRSGAALGKYRVEGARGKAGPAEPEALLWVPAQHRMYSLPSLEPGARARRTPTGQVAWSSLRGCVCDLPRYTCWRGLSSLLFIPMSPPHPHQRRS